MGSPAPGKRLIGQYGWYCGNVYKIMSWNMFRESVQVKLIHKAVDGALNPYNSDIDIDLCSGYLHVTEFFNNFRIDSNAEILYGKK